MPDPVSGSPNRSVYDPSQCDPSLASCAEPPKPNVVTIPDVVIEGHVPRRPPSCEQQQSGAIVGCILGAVDIAMSAHGGIGNALSSSLKEGFSCGKLVAEYFNCKQEGEARTAVANGCEADGGTALAGVEKNEIVCLKFSAR
jgi:hypothetical protein